MPAAAAGMPATAAGNGNQPPVGAAAGSGGTGNGVGGNTSAGMATGGTPMSAAGSGGAAAGASSAGATTGGAAGAGGGMSSAGAGSGGSSATCNPASGKAVTLYMIGDSTMSVYASDRYPRMGWGQPLGDLFDAKCATVADKALSGRSSKSFFDEGAWTPIKNALKPGDYVLIQFGHNDEKSEDATLYTEPQTTYKQFLTTYVNDTKAKQANPILLTSINRNGWSGSTVTNSHGLYPAAVRELAASLSVPLIDLTALTKTYFERIGQAETAKLFLILAAGQSPNYPAGVTDNTHLQEAGARAIGKLAMADAYAQKLPFAGFLKAAPVAP